MDLTCLQTEISSGTCAALIQFICLMEHYTNNWNILLILLRVYLYISLARYNRLQLVRFSMNLDWVIKCCMLHLHMQWLISVCFNTCTDLPNKYVNIYIFTLFCCWWFRSQSGDDGCCVTEIGSPCFSFCLFVNATQHTHTKSFQRFADVLLLTGR